MKRYLTYLKKYRKESILGPLFKLLESSFDLMIPLVVKLIVDTGIGNADHGYIWKMGGVMVLMGVVGLTFAVIAQYFAAKASVGFSAAVRGDLFVHINSLSYQELDTVGTSTLITRITSDVNQMQTGLNLSLRLLLRSPFIVFGAMIMAFTVDVKTAWIFVILIPALAVVVYGIMFLTMPYYKNIQKKLDEVLRKVRENLAGARVIQAFNRQEEEKAEFDQATGELFSIQVLAGKLSGIMNPLTYVFVNAGVIAVVWIGGGQVNKGLITTGAVIALWNYMSQILVELVKLANLIVTITKSLACANRVNSVFALKPGISENGEALRTEPERSDLSDPAARVEFQDVSFTYSGAKAPSLEHISFTAGPGETVGIIGGTGCGKSTLVNLIPRFYDASEGRVLSDRTDVRNLPVHQVRGRVGIVPQKAVLFAGTIRDNMRWGKKDASDKEIWDALALAQAKEFVEQKEGQLDAQILQGGKNLSGGQKQRLTIARALVRKPDILILDDSASALDFATDAKLRNAIASIQGRMTTFLVSQRAVTIKNADKIIVLEDGKVAGTGTHKELLKHCEVYREICLSQLTKEEVERDEQ